MLWSLEETNRAGGGVKGFWVAKTERSHANTQDWFAGGTFHSLSFCLVILLSVEVGEKKSYWKANITAGILLVHTARTRQSPSLRKGTEQPRRCFHTDTHKNRLLEHMEKWTSIQRRNPFNHFQSCRSVYKSLKLPRPQSKQPKKDFCVLHFWKTKTYFRSLTCYQQTKAGSNSGILANKYNQKTHVCKHL